MRPPRAPKPLYGVPPLEETPGRPLRSTPEFVRPESEGGFTDRPRQLPRSEDQIGGPGRRAHPYRDTRLWEGRAFYYRRVFPFALPVHTWQKFAVGCPVPIRLSISVNAGLAAVYFLPANPDTEQYHLLFAPQSEPSILDLPPGVHDLAVFAGLNTRAVNLETPLVATIVAMNREELPGNE